MPNKHHLALLQAGTRAWKNWRQAHPKARPRLHQADLTGAHLRRAFLRETCLHQAHLSEADLRRADLTKADLRRAFLIGADLRQAHLDEADLSRAHLTEANLIGAQLRQVDLREANLQEALLHRADLQKANLRAANLIGTQLHGANLREAVLARADLTLAELDGADLRGADLSGCRLMETNFAQANLSGCRLHRVSAWGVNWRGAVQRDLILTREGEPVIVADGLAVAQFIALLLDHQPARGAIAASVKNAVLIAGHFPPERKARLDSLRKELRRASYLPVLLDPANVVDGNMRATLLTLASLVRFMVADFPASCPLFKTLPAVAVKVHVPVHRLVEGELTVLGNFGRPAPGFLGR